MDGWCAKWLVAGDDRIDDDTGMDNFHSKTYHLRNRKSDKPDLRWAAFAPTGSGRVIAVVVAVAWIRPELISRMTAQVFANPEQIPGYPQYCWPDNHERPLLSFARRDRHLAGREYSSRLRMAIRAAVADEDDGS